MRDGVFIAMPVYRGGEVIEETLRSILAQSYQDFHLVMSVDGADDPTIEICRKYEHDPRIDVVVQESRLGWPGNFNWLVENCDREFFCYWQQDDLASTGYLDSLRRELLARPDAAIAYTDVQWFGARFDRNGSPSIEGSPLSRVVQHIEAIRYEPLRGLMRVSMLPPEGNAIPVAEDESCQEEFVLLARMAAAGAFVRVDSAMYFKRLHDSNSFSRWAGFPEWRRRRGWISAGLGMYKVAAGLAPEELRSELLAFVLDRMAVERPGRGFFYLPSQTSAELLRFVRDFIAHDELSPELMRLPEPSISDLDRPIHPEILAALQVERRAGLWRHKVSERLRQNGALEIEAATDAGAAFLGYGWSIPEEWGVWSDGRVSTLRVPSPRGSAWRATLRGRVHAPKGSVQIGTAVDRSAMQYNRISPAEPVHLTVLSTSGTGDSIRLDLPDARAPIDDGLSEDSRSLGFGLTGLAIELV